MCPPKILFFKTGLMRLAGVLGLSKAKAVGRHATFRLFYLQTSRLKRVAKGG
jgi:hypothetical protein